MPSARQITFSNLDKILFPDAGITKGQLIAYYERAAEHLLPHLRDRPLALQRFPDGIDKGGFYQKDASDYFPDWIPRVRVKKQDGELDHVLCHDVDTLVYLANQACVTLHTFLSRRDHINHPDLLLFDLDPPDGEIAEVQFAAREVRALMEQFGLAPFVKSSGSKGLHVTVPLDRSADFDTVRAFAQDCAALLAQRHPERLTTAMRKNKRTGRVFLDVARNAYAQLAVAPYTVRARPTAPVAVPLEWSEALSKKFDPQRYTIKNLFHRMARKEDPWKDIYMHGGNIGAARKVLDELRKPK